MLKTESLRFMKQSTKKLILVAITFCNCLLASDNFSSVVDRGSDYNLQNQKQNITPIYSDNIFYRYVKGKVFFIIGTSSAGKTSIRKVLNRHVPQMKKGEFLISSQDDLGKIQILRELRSNLPGKLDSITQKDLWYCLSTTWLTQRKNISEMVKTDAVFKKHEKLLLSDEWYDAAFPLQFSQSNAEDGLAFTGDFMLNSAKGKHIVLDVVAFLPFIYALENKFIRCEIYNIFVYSPPRTLMQHIEKRFHESLLTANRAGMRLFFPYHQYLDLYTNSSLNTGMCLTKREILSDFTGILHSIIENSGLPDHEKNTSLPYQKKLILK